MITPESKQPSPIERFVQGHMDKFIGERTSAFSDIPKDVQQLLCTIVGHVVTMSDQTAEATLLAYNPELTYDYYRATTPMFFKRNPDAWQEYTREQVRIDLVTTRFEQDLPIFLPHHAEGDYINSKPFCGVLCIIEPITTRCLYSLEQSYQLPE